MMNKLFQVPSYYSGMFGQSEIDGKLYTQSDEFVCDCVVIFREQDSLISFINFGSFIQPEKQADNTMKFKLGDYRRMYYKIKFNIVIKGTDLSVTIPKVFINPDVEFRFSSTANVNVVTDVVSSFEILESAELNLIEFNLK